MNESYSSSQKETLMARSVLLEVTFYEDGHVLWCLHRGKRAQEFSRSERTTLIAALKNKPTVRSASSDSECWIEVRSKSGRPDDRFKDEVLTVAREFFSNVEVVDPFNKSRLHVGTKRLAHIVYITDARHTQAVIVLPGKVSADHYLLLPKFESFGMIDMHDKPVRVHIHVRRMDPNFEKEFMAEVTNFFKVGRVERCSDVRDANRRVIPGMRRH